ncbi:MAG: dUTP diphosphatase [Fastidiosipilaceae bacterium]
MNNEEIQIKVIRLRPNIELPSYMHKGDSGMDVRAAEDMLIRPGESVLVPTGLIFEIPYGWEIQIRPRSGLSYKTPLRLPNSPGTIDSGFRDELHILMHNSSCPCQSEEEDAVYDLNERSNRKGTYRIHAGDRIAQMVFGQVARVRLVAAETISNKLYDRGGGFGHSGVD